MNWRNYLSISIKKIGIVIFTNLIFGTQKDVKPHQGIIRPSKFFLVNFCDISSAFTKNIFTICEYKILFFTIF